MTSMVQACLQGRHMLMVEDEYIIAVEIAQTLSTVSAKTIGPDSAVIEALHLIATEGWIGGAHLDVNLGRDTVWPVVDILIAPGTPMVLATGYDIGAIPEAYARLPFLREACLRTRSCSCHCQRHDEGILPMNYPATITSRHRVSLFIRKLRRDASMLPEDEAILADLITSKRLVERGDIVREGAHQRSVVLVMEGWVCHYKQLENGKRQITAVFIPGYLCQPFGATLRVLDHSLAALSSAVLSFVPPQHLLGAARSNPRIEEALWCDLLKTDGLAREHMVSLGRRSAIERLGHFFCEMHERLAVIGLVEGNTFDLPLTQLDLADLFGLSAVHVNRALQDLRSSGLLSMRSRKATLPDVTALRELSMFSPADPRKDGVVYSRA